MNRAFIKFADLALGLNSRKSCGKSVLWLIKELPAMQSHAQSGEGMETGKGVLL